MEHLEHLKCEVWPFRNLPSGGRTGPGEGSAQIGTTMYGFDDVEDGDAFESVLSVLGWRDLRRKGIDGRRKVGKTEGTAWESEGLRRKDIGFRAQSLHQSATKGPRNQVRAHSSSVVGAIVIGGRRSCRQRCAEYAEYGGARDR